MPLDSSIAASHLRGSREYRRRLVTVDTVERDDEHAGGPLKMRGALALSSCVVPLANILAGILD